MNATRVGILKLHTNNFMTAGNIMLLRAASNASENMAASGWLASCDTGTKVALRKRASRLIICSVGMLFVVSLFKISE